MKRITMLMFASLAIIFLIISTGVVYSQTTNQPNASDTEYYKIPTWIKHNAQGWANGAIGDEDFLKGIEYLINQTIIVIPPSQQGTGGTEHGIPVWIKNVARWWAQGAIGDDDFVKGMQFLVANDIIHVKINEQHVPAPPQNLQATGGSVQISLSWQAPNDGGSAITGYTIYRSTSSGTETLLTSAGNVTSYNDTGLTNGITYYYMVSAVNSVGESAQSSEADATSSAPPPPGPNPKQISLIFVQYPDPSEQSQVLDIMHQSLKYPFDYVQVEPFNGVYKQFTDQRQMGIAASISQMQSIIQNPPMPLSQYYAIAYDFEHWTTTPPNEQADPVGFANQAADMVHQAGLKFCLNPDWAFMSANYKQYPWSKVDIVWIQTGQIANTISEYKSTLPAVMAYIKQANPQIQIIIQNSLGHVKDPLYPDPVTQFNLETDIALQNGANGIGIVYLSPTKSPNYTISNLEGILSHFSDVTQR